MKFNNEKLDKKFNINSDFYDKDLVSFVDWYCEKMANDCKGENEKMALKSLKPFMLNYSHNLLVFVMSVDGDFKRIDELKIKIVEDEKIKPITEIK